MFVFRRLITIIKSALSNSHYIYCNRNCSDESGLPVSGSHRGIALRLRLTAYERSMYHEHNILIASVDLVYYRLRLYADCVLFDFEK